MLIRKSERQDRHGALASTLAAKSGVAFDRRSFLRRSGLVAGGFTVLGIRLPASARPRPAHRRLQVRR